MDEHKYSRFDPNTRHPHSDLAAIHSRLQGHCTRCNGLGVVVTTNDGEQIQCICKTESEAIHCLDKAGVPREYWEYNFDDGKLKPFIVHDIRSRTAAYRHSASNWRQLNLLLHGPYRTGKTAVAALILKEYFRGNELSQCTYLNARDLLTVARSKDPDLDIEWLKLSDIVVVDELGKEASDEWDKLKFVSTLDIVLRARRGSRATVLISNLSPEKLASVYGENFSVILQNDFDCISFESFERLNVK